MAWNYSDKTKKLFMDAIQGKPGTHLGEVDDPDGVGEHGAIACGDALRFTFRVEKHSDDPTQDIIVEARYQTFGCTSAIAASEALCALIENGRYTPIKALSITNQDIVDFLDGLPEEKIHCSVMGAEALEAAVFNWAEKRGVDFQELGVDIQPEEKEEGRLVCKCFSLSEPYLKRKIKELDLKTIPEIIHAIKAGGACQSCHYTQGGLQDILNEVWGKGPGGKAGQADASAEQAEKPAELSTYQFNKLIEKTVVENIQPMLEKDGGGIEIVDIKEQLVYCALKGACAHCAGATQTLKVLVEKSLKDRVDQRIRVIEVKP